MVDMFKVYFRPEAIEDLEKLDKPIAQRILKKTEMAFRKLWDNYAAYASQGVERKIQACCW